MFMQFLGCGRTAGDPAQATDGCRPEGGRFWRCLDGRLYVKTRGVGADLQPTAPFLRAVPPVDVPTYHELGWYSLDRHRVYIEQETSDGLSIHVLAGADPATFSVFGYRWGKDARHVWHDGIILDAVAPAELVVIPGQDARFFDYVRDARRVFVGHREIVGADAASFTCQPDPADPSRVIASDLNYVWNTNEWTARDGFARSPK